MSFHAALVRPVLHTPRGRHAKPRPAWPRVAARAAFLVVALISAAGVWWAPVPVLLVAGVAKLRTATRKIDTILAEELTGTAAREAVPETADAVEIY